MSTYREYGITVNSKKVVLQECEKASYIDCRTNAYPFIVDEE